MKVIAWPAGGANPYNRLLSSHLTALGLEVEDFSPLRLLRASDAIWHIHWPEHMLSCPSGPAAAFRAAGLLMLAFWARLRRIRLVWTVHNLRPHEHDHPWVGGWFWPVFVRQLGGFIALSAAGRHLAEARHPRLKRIPGFIVPHGHYRGVYADSVSRAEARSRLGLPAEAPVAAFVGSIRAYKNVPHLIDSFRNMRDQAAHLLVAGRPYDRSVGETVERAAAGAPRVHLSLGFVPEEEIQLYLRAADLVVLPFRDTLNSGSSLLALSFDRPILVPRVGAIAELEEQVGTEWVQAYSGELTPELLADALMWAHRARPGRCEALGRLGWEQLARKTQEAYYAIIRSGRAPQPVEGRASV